VNDLHPGDVVLNGVLKALPGLYTKPRDRAEALLRAFLKPHIKALQRREDESTSKYKMRLMAAFKGAKWAITRHKIAVSFSDVHETVNDNINDGLITAYMDGLNESAYAMALSGITTWPVTLSVMNGLIAANIITLNTRKLKKRQDIAYNEERVQSAVHSAILQGVKIEDLPDAASKMMAKARQNEAVSYARAAIYGASDSGAYFAGLEAEKMGIEVEKTWLSIMDMRVRPSHKHLHGVTIPLKDDFHGYYSDLRYPHDPAAHPAEIYRCRCRMAVHVAGKSPGEYSRELLPTQTAAYRIWRDKQIRKVGGELELLKLHKKLVR